MSRLASSLFSLLRLELLKGVSIASEAAAAQQSGIYGNSILIWKKFKSLAKIFAKWNLQRIWMKTWPLANVLGQIAKTISKWARCVFPKLVVSVRSLSNSPQELFMLHFLGGIMPRPVFVILAKSKHAYGVSCFCPCELHFIQLSFLLP